MMVKPMLIYRQIIKSTNYQITSSPHSLLPVAFVILKNIFS